MEIRTLFPRNIKTRKAKIAYWIFRKNYTIERGRGAVIGRFTSAFSEVGWLMVALKYFGIHNPTIWSVIIGLVAAVVLSYILGEIFMYYNLDRIEAQVNAERNPLVNEVHKQIVKNETVEEL